VFWFSLEMDVSSLKYILNAHKNEWNSIPNVKVIDDTSTLTHYENLIAEYETSVLVIDSLSELLDDDGGDPAGNAKRIMKWVKKIRRRYNVAVILIHHNRKATEGNKKPNKLSDIEGSYHFARTTETAITFWEDSRGIELSVVKARFGPKESYYLERNKHLWFKRKDGSANSNRSAPVSDDRERTESDKSPRSGHRDKLHGFTPGSFSFGFGSDDRRE
jgi:RecA-family ATPase